LIVTLTINPAIDRVISVDRLAFDDRSYMKSSGESPGVPGFRTWRGIYLFVFAVFVVVVVLLALAGTGSLSAALGGAGHLRAVLRDVLCGHLDPDLRTLADELIEETAWDEPSAA